VGWGRNWRQRERSQTAQQYGPKASRVFHEREPCPHTSLCRVGCMRRWIPKTLRARLRCGSRALSFSLVAFALCSTKPRVLRAMSFRDNDYSTILMGFSSKITQLTNKVCSVSGSCSVMECAHSAIRSARKCV
jgi:hypothetical protein